MLAPVLGALSDRFGGGRFARLAGRRCCRLRIMATALSFGFSISADRGRHHRGRLGGSRRYIADITDGDERARTSAS
ncbi:TCR/Tet family MFS transporter (plasmid) [Klebsiella pneumoniae]|nr:TCR/Tet family MFS transporter [Klebsiella pneumoniae]